MFQGRLKGAGEAIAMHNEVAAGIIILAECQVVMFAEIGERGGEENRVLDVLYLSYVYLSEENKDYHSFVPTLGENIF